MAEALEATEPDIYTAGTARNFTAEETLGCYKKKIPATIKTSNQQISCMELQLKENYATISASTADCGIATSLHENKISEYTMADYLNSHFVEIPNSIPKTFRANVETIIEDGVEKNQKVELGNRKIDTSMKIVIFLGH